MQDLLLWLGPLLELAAIAGLVVRRRLRRAYLLPAFLLATLLADLAVGLRPGINTWHFWLVKEGLHAALLAALGVELAIKILGRMPAPARQARRWMIVTAVVTTLLVATLPEGYLALELTPRLLAGTAGLYVGIFMVMWRFRIPPDPLHKTVLLSLAPYMLLYSATWHRVRDADTARLVGLANSLMFAAVLLALTLAAWRSEPAPGAPATTVAKLWPWRRSR
jgi:hypothetical protein